MMKSKFVKVNQKIENAVVDGFEKVTDKFVEKFFIREGETLKRLKSVWLKKHEIKSR